MSTTTQSTPTAEALYLQAFRSLQRNGLAHDPVWAFALREAAIARFAKLGFPTARRGNEEWKYTDIRPIASQPFHSAAPHTPTTDGLEPFLLGNQMGSRLLFLDGHYVPELSSTAGQPAGVAVADLAEAMTSAAPLVEQHLARHADYESQAFTALNTAFLGHGAFVLIPNGARVEQPIHLLFLFTDRAAGTVSHPRVLIVAGRDSEATVVETYGGLSDAPYFANAVTEVVVQPGAKLRYYKLQRQSEQAFHVSTTQAVLAENSSFASVNVDMGGGLVRNNLNVLMAEEGALCSLHGLYMVTGTQHVDNQVIVDHAKGHTTTRELYKGILNGKSRSVFHGSVIVRKDARKVNAMQVDKNLLLSDQAEADTKPAFWIDCDDVRCGHGAACGQMDENALFYLRTRGIGERAARALLVRAFVSEVVDTIESEPVRAQVEGLVQARLRDWLGSEDDAAPWQPSDGAIPPAGTKPQGDGRVRAWA